MVTLTLSGPAAERTIYELARIYAIRELQSRLLHVPMWNAPWFGTRWYEQGGFKAWQRHNELTRRSYKAALLIALPEGVELPAVPVVPMLPAPSHDMAKRPMCPRFSAKAEAYAEELSKLVMQKETA